MPFTFGNPTLTVMHAATALSRAMLALSALAVLHAAPATTPPTLSPTAAPATTALDLGVAPRHWRTSDTQCGSRHRATAWIDVPTYWLNVDGATERAEAMRAQLRAALLPGACATRVPAVLTASTRPVRPGGGQPRPASGPFGRQLTRPIELAIFASHLRAIHAASAVAGHALFLVLEDDVDLLSFPRGRLAPLCRRAYFASQMARALPSGWSFGILNVLAHSAAWHRLRSVWRKALRLQAGAVAAIGAEDFAPNKKRACPVPLWSAAGYLVSAEGAARVLDTWPVRELRRPQSQARAVANISRTCWIHPFQWSRCLKTPRVAWPDARLNADDCMLFSDWGNGPALAAGAAARIRTMEGLEAAYLDAARAAGRMQSYVLMPLPIANAENNSTSAQVRAHPDQSEMVAVSRRAQQESWRDVPLDCTPAPPQGGGAAYPRHLESASAAKGGDDSWRRQQRGTPQMW